MERIVDSLLDLFADGNDFSAETMDRNRNIFYQKELAKEIIDQTSAILSLVTQSLNIHLNLGQQFQLTNPSLVVSLETLTLSSLSKKEIQPIPGVQLRFPSTINASTSTNGSTSVRVRILLRSSIDRSTRFDFSPPSNHWRRLAMVNRRRTRISLDRFR